MAEKLVRTWMPGCLDCPLARHPGENNIYIRELIFSYDCSEDCKDCPIIKKVNRHMIQRVACQEIDEALQTAEVRGCGALYIHFVGGDPFEHYEEFRAVCDYAVGLRSSVKLGLDSVTTFRKVPQDAFTWLRQLSGTLKLGIRYDRLRLDRAIPDEYVSLFKACGYELICHVSRDNISGMMRDVAEACSLDIPVRLEYDNMGSWTVKYANAYLDAIAAEQAAIFASPRIASCFASLACEVKCHERIGSITINAVDTTGAVYLCSRCSPLRLKQKQLEGRNLRNAVESYRQSQCSTVNTGSSVRRAVGSCTR